MYLCLYYQLLSVGGVSFHNTENAMCSSHGHGYIAINQGMWMDENSIPSVCRAVCIVQYVWMHSGVCTGHACMHRVLLYPREFEMTSDLVVQAPLCTSSWYRNSNGIDRMSSAYDVLTRGGQARPHFLHCPCLDLHKYLHVFWHVLYMWVGTLLAIIFYLHRQ